MRNKGLPLQINPTMRYKYSSYWHTWNRVLQYPTWDEKTGRHLDMIEFSMTAVNNWDFEWPGVAEIRIRKHGTAFDKNDVFSNVIPMDWWDYIGEKIGTERRDFMAYHNSFLDEIDWDKYSRICNGGAPFDLIRKD